MWDLLPLLGLIGSTALREAFDGDFRQLEEILRGALKRLFKMTGDEDPWPCVQALFRDSVVVERDGKLWRYPYTIDGTEVSLGQPTEVMKAYQPVSDAASTAGAGGVFVESVEGAARWRIRVIRAGLSGNRNFYPDAVLREAVPLFEGVRVFIKGDDEHIAGKGKDVRNLIGRLTEPAFIEGVKADTGEIQAVFELIEPDGGVAVKLREAWDRGMSSLFGFSIDAIGPARTGKVGGRQVRAAKAISKVNSVDLIVEPGAGGEVINLIEAQSNPSKETVMNREQIIAMLEAQGLLTGKKTDDLTDDQLQEILREALAAAGAEEGNGDDAMREAVDGEDDAPVTQAQMRMIEARANMRTVIGASTLPDLSRQRLISGFETQERFAEADVIAAIDGERDYLARLTESGAVVGLGSDVVIQTGETQFEKVAQMLEAFFDPGNKDHKHAGSFKECYIQITGDKNVTGNIKNCDQARMREALDSTTFPDALGDSIARRMIALYNAPDMYSLWRRIVTIGRAGDFRTQERIRIGGYGDLPAVAEKANYPELASPTDEKATFAVSKRGGTESVTLEMIKNDDVSVIRQIPNKLSRAAKRTLAKFVFDFIKDGPVIYDGVAFFHATHNNLFTAALADASFAAHRLAMKNQTEMDSGDPLGIPPKFLLVPDELEQTAFDMFRRDTNNDETFVQTLKPEVIPVWYWTDANDWATMADPNDIPTIEIAFLDGEEEPALFIQDNPTSGSMFANDSLTWKIRHIYGGAVADYRGATKAVVA